MTQPKSHLRDHHFVCDGDCRRSDGTRIATALVKRRGDRGAVDILGISGRRILTYFTINARDRRARQTDRRAFTNAR